MRKENHLLVFQYTKNESYGTARFTFEYWGSSRHANVEAFRRNYFDHLILNVKDYK